MHASPAHSVGSAGPLEILSRDELGQLDAAALAVLEDVGVSIPSARARRALEGRTSSRRSSRTAPSSTPPASWSGRGSG